MWTRHYIIWTDTACPNCYETFQDASAFLFLSWQYRLVPCHQHFTKWKVEWKFMRWNTSPNSHDNTGIYWKYNDWINIHLRFLPPCWLLHLGLHFTTQPQKWTQLGREIRRSECGWNWQCKCVRYFHCSQLTPGEVDSHHFYITHLSELKILTTVFFRCWTSHLSLQLCCMTDGPQIQQLTVISIDVVLVCGESIWV